MIIKGYIIKNFDKDYLTKNLFWFNHDRIEDAYVHETIPDYSNWGCKPDKFIKAIYSDGVVKIEKW